MKLNGINKRNVAFLLAAQAVSALVGIFAFTRIGHELPITEMGRFGFALYSTVLFGLLAELGIRFVAMSEIALNPDNSWQIYQHSVRMRWSMAGISVLVLGLVILLIPSWRSEWHLLLLAGAVAITQFGSDPATWVFFGRGRLDLGASILIVDRGLYLVAIHLASLMMPSAEGLLLGALLANLLRMLMSARWVSRQTQKPAIVSKNKTLSRKLIYDGAAIGIAILTFVSYSQLTIILMQSYADPVELGYYAMAFGIFNVLIVIPTSLIMAVFPSVAAQLASSEDDNHRVYKWSIYSTLIVSIPIAFMLLMFAEEILVFWMGGQYLPAADILQLLAIAFMFSTINFLLRLFLFSCRKFKAEALLNSAAFIITLLIGIPICKQFGAIGIAAVFVGVEITVVMIKTLLSWKKINLAPPAVNNQLFTT